MRTPPRRTLRPFLPATASLEERAAVSSLMPGLSGPAPVTFKPVAAKYVTTAPIPPSLALKTSVHATAAKATTRIAVSASPAVHVGSQLTTASWAADRRAFGSLVTTASARSTANQVLPFSANAHPANFIPLPHGGSGVMIKTATTATAVSPAPVTTPAQPASATGFLVKDPTFGIIRPLTLAPSQPIAHTGSASSSSGIRALDDPSGGGDSGGGVSGSSGDSGGGVSGSSGDSGGGVSGNSGDSGEMEDPVPVFTDNLAPDIIGMPASISVAPPAGSKVTITNVNWAEYGIVDGVMVPNIADGEFVYPTNNIDSNHSTTLKGYWGPSGGITEIMADVTYSNSMTNGNSTAYYPSQSGVISLTTSTIKSTQITNATNFTGQDVPIFAYGASLANNDWLPGISWNVWDSAGTADVVQIMTSGNYAESTDPALGPVQIYQALVKLSGGKFVWPGNLVDMPTTAGSPFYSQGVTPSLPPGIAEDTPSIQLSPGIVSVLLNANFTDYIMLQPTGGIWVPAGTFSWSVNALATRPNSNADWTAVDLTPPGITQSLETGTNLPQWVGSTASYLNGWKRTY